MLKIQGQIDCYCDGVPRRHFLQIGGLALGGLSMSRLHLALLQRLGVNIDRFGEADRPIELS